MKTPILGSTYVARSVNAADSRMVNLFPEIVPEAGKEPAFLQRAPGLRLLATLGTGPVRGLWQLGGFGYAVSGNTLYKIAPSWTSTALGSVAGTGPVSMADNGTQLFIAANGPSYIYNSNTNTFAQIADPDFPGAVTVGYLDGYFVFNEPNSQKIWVTSLLEGTQIDPLDFASAEGSPDGLLSILVSNREVWLFGTNSAEVWYDAGTADFPLQRIQGAFNEIGCAATYSVAKMDNGIFWLGADARGRGIVYRANGYQAQRISTHAVEWHIQQYGNLSDAIGYTYQQDGHSFYVLIFPQADTTWVYDVATQAWHERAGWDNGDFTRHRSNCQMAFNSEVVVGDYQNGDIYAFDLDVYADNGQIQRWLRSWRALPTGQNTLRRTAHHTLQLDCETGVGLEQYPAYDSQDLATENGLLLVAEYVQNDLATEAGDELTTEANDNFALIADSPDYPIPFVPPMLLATTSYLATPGYDPQVMLRWSDDAGHTWSNERWTSIGRIGQYGKRAFWRRLGMTMKIRDRVYEISGTDPVKIAIMGAELRASPTNA
jgi:hypothetical protein